MHLLPSSTLLAELEPPGARVHVTVPMSVEHLDVFVAHFFARYRHSDLAYFVPSPEARHARAAAVRCELERLGEKMTARSRALFMTDQGQQFAVAGVGSIINTLPFHSAVVDMRTPPGEPQLASHSSAPEWLFKHVHARLRPGGRFLLISQPENSMAVVLRREPRLAALGWKSLTLTELAHAPYGH